MAATIRIHALNERADELVAQARRTFNEIERHELVAEALACRARAVQLAQGAA